MINSAFDLGEELKLREISYKLYNLMWQKHDLSAIDLSLNNWTTIKYLNDSTSDFHSDISKLPNDSGGLYLFFIKCSIIPGITDFPVYIGRALKTDGQNLRKRCREYFRKYSANNERPKITRMFKYWSEDLFLSFIPIVENKDVIDFEKKLINSLLLPFNDEIPEIEIRQAVKAFNL